MSESQLQIKVTLQTSKIIERVAGLLNEGTPTDEIADIIGNEIENYYVVNQIFDDGINDYGNGWRAGQLSSEQIERENIRRTSSKYQPVRTLKRIFGP